MTEALATSKNEIILGIQAFIFLRTSAADPTTVLHYKEKKVRGSGFYEQENIIYSKISFSLYFVFVCITSPSYHRKIKYQVASTVAISHLLFLFSLKSRSLFHLLVLH